MRNKTPIILASTSSRRQELLRQIGLEFEVVAGGVSEDVDEEMLPEEIAKTLAERKCVAVAQKRPEALVIGADTIVCLGDKVWSKPENPAHAIQILKTLNGCTHQVITGVSLLCIDLRFRELFAVTTEVAFGQAPDELIAKYVRSGEPLDKAGAYGIQGLGALLVKSIRGSYSNVMGLPLYELGAAIRRALGEKVFFHRGSNNS